MAYGHDEYHQPLCLQLTDDTVIPHAIPPQSKLAGTQRFAKIPRVFGRGYAQIHIIEDFPLDLAVELLEILQSSRIVFNAPGQVVSGLAGW